MPATFAAILQRIRSYSPSIGQMTFGSFLLLLTVITATGMASVIAIRHIDTTFGELHAFTAGTLYRPHDIRPVKTGPDAARRS